MPDTLTESCADLLDGVYDCVDRIVVNAYFPLAQTGGIDTNRPRLRAVMEAVIALSPSPQGFVVGRLAG
jgi:hypothetical protein